MEIFSFEDMNIYHDDDWNEMQRKIYREVKERDIQNSCKLELLNSNYEYLLYDSLVNLDSLQSSSNLVFNEDRLVIEDNPDADSSFTTIDYSIDVETTEIYLIAGLEGDATLPTYEVSIDSGSTWTTISNEVDEVLDSSSQTFQLRFSIPQNSGIEIEYFTLFLNKV